VEPSLLEVSSSLEVARSKTFEGVPLGIERMISGRNYTISERPHLVWMNVGIHEWHWIKIHILPVYISAFSLEHLFPLSSFCMMSASLSQQFSLDAVRLN
jgi:hypothetical protein